jgi:hypothetical protein
MTTPNRTSPAYNNINDAYRRERDALVALLRAKDKAGWNTKLTQIEYPQLLEADLTGVELIEFNFENADLRCAKLNGANLSGSSFKNADLRGAQFKNAYGRQAVFDGADLLEARMEESTFCLASFRNVQLASAILTRGTFRSTDFSGSNLSWARFDDADLDGASGMMVSGTLVRGARFSQRSSDLWSRLRQSYTGFRFGLNLVLIGIFFIPYIAKATFWSALSRLQETRVAGEALHAGVCQSIECREVSIFKLLIGGTEPLANTILVLLLVLYAILRFAMTVHIASLREHEDRTGFTPPVRVPHPRVGKAEMPLQFLATFRDAYGWLVWPHRIIQILQVLAVLSVLYHSVYWLSQTVTLPIYADQ